MASSSSEASLVQLMAKQNEVLEKMSQKLSDVVYASGIAAEKLCHIEGRQCSSEGAGTDSSRFADNWARATSAYVHQSQWIELVERICEADSIEAVSYNYLFEAKDKRRAEALAAFFWKSVEKEARDISKFQEPDYQSLGELLPWMPSGRSKLLAIASKLGKRVELERNLPEAQRVLSVCA